MLLLRLLFSFKGGLCKFQHQSEVMWVSWWVFIDIIVFFKRLGSRGFHDLSIVFFSNHYEYCKTGALEFFVDFFRFFERRSLDFLEYEMSMGLYNGKKSIVQLWCCHDLQTADGEFVLKIIAIGYMVYLKLNSNRKKNTRRPKK